MGCVLSANSHPYYINIPEGVEQPAEEEGANELGIESRIYGDECSTNTFSSFLHINQASSSQLNITTLNVLCLISVLFEQIRVSS